MAKLGEQTYPEEVRIIRSSEERFVQPRRCLIRPPHKELVGLPFHLWCLLKDFADEGGATFVGLARLGELLYCDERTIRRAIEVLIRHQLVERTTRTIHLQDGSWRKRVTYCPLLHNLSVDHNPHPAEFLTPLSKVEDLSNLTKTATKLGTDLSKVEDLTILTNPASEQLTELSELQAEVLTDLSDEVEINTLSINNLNNNNNDNNDSNSHPQENSGRRRGRGDDEDEDSIYPNNTVTPHPPIAASNGRRGRGRDEDEYSSLPNNPATPHPPRAASNAHRDELTISATTNHDDNRDGEALLNRGGRRGRDEEAGEDSANRGSAVTQHPPTSASNGRRGRDGEGAGEQLADLSSMNPPAEATPPLTPEERTRYQKAEGRLRSHYGIPASRQPSPPTVKLLLELAREFSDAEVSHIFDVVDAEKDRSGGVPPRQQYLRTTILNVKRERGEHEEGDDDERTKADRPRTYGAAVPSSGGRPTGAAGASEPEGLRELRERVWAMRAGSAPSSSPQRPRSW